MEGTGPSLFGRYWLTKICLDWGNLNRIDTDDRKSELEGVLDNHADVFKDELGLLQNVTAKIHIDEQAKTDLEQFHTLYATK